MEEYMKIKLGRRAKDYRKAKVVYFTKLDKFDTVFGLSRNLSDARLYDIDEPDEKITSNYDLIWKDGVEIWRVNVTIEVE